MYPESFFETLWKLFNLSGYHLSRLEPFPKNISHRIYDIFIGFACLIYFVPSEVYMLRFSSRSLETLIDHMGMLVIHTVGTLKAFNLHYNLHKFKNIIEILESKQFRYENYQDFTPGEYVQKIKKLLRICIICYAILACGAPVVRVIAPFIEYTQNINGNLTCSKILPFYNWFFFDIEKYCGFALILQNIFMVHVACIIISADLAFSGAVLYCRTHFVNIHGAFRTVRQRCYVRLNIPEDYKVFKDCENQPVEEEIMQEIRKITKHMQSIIEVVETVEDLFSIPLVIQVLGSLATLVACLFMISNEPTGSSVFYAQIELMIAIFIQLGYYCVFGNELTLAFEQIRSGIWDADWLPYSQRVKTVMLMDIMRLQKPVHVTIGKFAPLTLQTYLSIIKGSYSYYTILENRK